MSQESREQLSATAMDIQNRVAPIVVLAYLFIALTVFLVTPMLFVSAVRTPFMGAFIEHTLMINTSQPTQPGAWGEGLKVEGKRLGFGYQIAAINGQAVSSTRQLREILSQHQVGEVVEVVTRTPQGGEQAFSIELMSLPMADRVSYFIIPYLTGLVYLLSGLYVFGIRRFDPAGRAFVLFAASAGIGLASLFDLYTTNYLTPAWTFALAIAAGGLVNLALLFPEPVRQVVRYPFLGWIGYGVAILLGLGALFTLGNFTYPTAYVSAWRFIFIYMALGLAFFLAMTVYRRLRAQSPIVREQARLIFWGALLAFTPLGLWLVITVFYPSLVFTSYLLLPLGIFPVFTAYAIVRYRLLRTDYVLSQGVLYAVLAGMAMAGYALLVGGLSMVVGGVLKPADPLLIGLLVFLLAIGLNPVRVYLQGVIDRFFFRGQIVYREKSQAFARELTQVMELDEIVKVLRRYVDEALQPSYLHIYVFEPLSGHYVATAGEEDRAPTSDIRFPVNSPLVQTLSRQREALFISDMANLPVALLPEQARLNLLWAMLFVPLPGRKQLIGWIALGTRRSGSPYTSRDLAFLAGLSDQAALAVERAQVVADLERRVREMNVLTRVAQGVSYTVAFDDILELIATQTNQVMPARDMRFTLYDKETDVIYHAFYLENDERIPEMENRPMALTRGLEGEIIRSQRAVMTDDYEHETRGRGLLSTLQGVYAWMGVPLNAGAETIGAISVASRDPAVVYTDEQLNLLQAIADQASGAIVKARSLDESERRARQLAKLNEIGLSLTSTLEIKPLLNQILESAVDILNCQAGSLFLVDPQTDELVFEVVLGPVAADLTGKRLPPGTGMVGQAVITGRPIIANDAKRRKEWFEKTDEQTGFDTQDLLAVPMRVQERVIGVIELINKSNGAPFVQADQELLTAFTSQATIAIENARMYTMTDQALAARVEELSVMQRVDRELNASLDIERAMRLTLDWAMRQSRAEAGLVGTVEQDGIHVMTFQGYTTELEPYRPVGDGAHYRLPADYPLVSDVIQKGQPRCILESEVVAESGSPDGAQLFGLLPGARQQIVIPIRRETTTIGVMLLENRRAEACPEDMLSFLTRLSDHAAIAIANAQLYEEVKEANLAKSLFVSFVAHELKNPMASIKGYTELVSGGMAGPVNEMQSSFLATVRSNVDRMNTIVSDLNDLTKIQVGNMRLDYKAVQVHDVMDEVMRSFKRQVDEKKQVFDVSLPEGLPDVWVDPARMVQILTNLVSNAHKYTNEGGAIYVGAERQAAQEGALAGSEFVHLWVKDSGIGISEEDQRKIFEQYFRTDAAKEMASGTGLGLSITRSLVEMQGGRIWFDSASGQGTTFHVTFPVAETQ